MRILSRNLASLLLVPLLIGCVQSYNLGDISALRSAKTREIFNDVFKINADIEYIEKDSSFVVNVSITDTTNDAILKNTKTVINIDKIPKPLYSGPRHINRNPLKILREELQYDPKVLGYTGKYKLVTEGKYKIQIEILEINGEPLKKEVFIYYSQNLQK